jgi:hypothetical protein
MIQANSEVFTVPWESHNEDRHDRCTGVVLSENRYLNGGNLRMMGSTYEAGKSATGIHMQAKEFCYALILA